MDNLINKGKLLDFKSITPTSVIFTKDGKEVGKILIEKDGLKFIGNADKSAKVFFDYFLKPIVDSYIKEKIELFN